MSCAGTEYQFSMCLLAGSDDVTKQTCERQVAELTAFAERGAYDVVHVFKETASWPSASRAARNQNPKSYVRLSD